MSIDDRWTTFEFKGYKIVFPSKFVWEIKAILYTLIISTNLDTNDDMTLCNYALFYI